MLKLELLPEQPPKPGYGRLYLSGWLGQSLNVHITIQRIQDQYYLSEDGHWQEFQVILCLPELKKTISGDHWLTLGQQYVIPLLSDPLAKYYIALSDGHHTISSELIIADELRSLSPSDQFRYYANPSADTIISKANNNKAATAKLPSTTLPEWQRQDSNETIVKDQRQNSVSKKDKRWSLTLLWNIFLLVVITSTSIGSLMLWMTPKEENVHDKNNTVSIPLACSTSAMNSLGELDFVRSCLKSTSDSKIILDVITLAKMENHCGIAQRLYAYKAQSGDIAIALAYAKEYDFQETPSTRCFAADIEAARYWYEKVLNYDGQNIEAKARLSALKE